MHQPITNYQKGGKEGPGADNAENITKPITNLELVMDWQCPNLLPWKAFEFQFPVVVFVQIKVISNRLITLARYQPINFELHHLHQTHNISTFSKKIANSSNNRHQICHFFIFWRRWLQANVSIGLVTSYSSILFVNPCFLFIIFCEIVLIVILFPVSLFYFVDGRSMMSAYCCVDFTFNFV